MHSNNAAIIVPLYQYPLTENTWKPLYAALSTFKSLRFVIIVNINSGPGVGIAGWLPDKHYRREIPRLNAFPNVMLVGYVRIDYCRRPIEEVRMDLTKYSNWSGAISNVEADTLCHSYERSESESAFCLVGKPELALQGIFFDEVPNLYSEGVAAYLDTIDRDVKNSLGILGQRMVIHNPGTVPDREFAFHWQNSLNGPRSPLRNQDSALKAPFGNDEKSEPCGPDMAVVFEESNDLWLKSESQSRLQKLLSYEWDRCCYIVHSVPSDTIDQLVVELKNRGAYLFVTDLCEAYYQSFGNCWWKVLEAISMDKSSSCISYD